MKKFISILLLTMPFALVAETIWHSDGSYSIRNGNTTHHSDGSWSIRNGNTQHNSDGSYSIYGR